MALGTTNYTSTFIEVAEDCKVPVGEEPVERNGKPTVASMQYAMIAENPYAYTSDDVIFTVHAERQGINEEDRAEAREAFFSKGQACLRASPLGKTYGWGIHHDAESRVALVPVGSTEYAAFRDDPSLKHTKAMRSKRV